VIAIIVVYLAFGRTFWRLVRGDAEFQALTITLALVLAGGTVFYWHVEGFTLFDSFYFSVITLATVGYGDFTPHTTLGRAFTVVYVIVGIGILLSFINKFAALETEIRQRRRDVAADLADREHREP
jgi:hypothetical protein